MSLRLRVVTLNLCRKEPVVVKVKRHYFLVIKLLSEDAFFGTTVVLSLICYRNSIGIDKLIDNYILARMRTRTYMLKNNLILFR